MQMLCVMTIRGPGPGRLVASEELVVRMAICPYTGVLDVR